MTLVKEGTQDEPSLNLVQVSGQSAVQVTDLSSTVLPPYDVNQLKNAVLDEGESSETTTELVKSPAKGHASSLCSPDNLNSSGTLFMQSDTNHHHHHEGANNKSVINFKSGYNDYVQGSAAVGALLSFQQVDNAFVKVNNRIDEELAWDMYQWNNYSPRSSIADPRQMESLNSIITVGKDSQHGNDESCGWFYSEATVLDDSGQDSGPHEATANKRAFMGDTMQASKRPCPGSSKKTKPKPSGAKDPQSIAAKNRRERISERLKILQELVPNGSKVDLVTMLEKAISYVKFLQLQVKILATDEFWPVQNGKAPDISQVKEAIDAILSSQRDRNSTTNSK